MRRTATTPKVQIVDARGLDDRALNHGNANNRTAKNIARSI